jgi:hypothetical protein
MRKFKSYLISFFIVSVFLILPSNNIAQSEESDYDFTLIVQESGLRGISSVFLSPDGSKAGIINDNHNIHIYDLALRQWSIEKVLSDFFIMDGCWLDAGIVLLVAAAEPTGEDPDPIMILSPLDLSKTSSHSIDSLEFRDVYPSKDRSMLALVRKKAITVVDSTSFSILYQFSHPSQSIGTVQWNSDGTKLASAGYRIYLHDLGSGTNTEIPDSQKSSRELLWTSDSSILYNLENMGILEKYDAIEGELTDTIPVASQFECGALSSDDEALCYAEGWFLGIRSLSSNELLCSLEDATDEIDDIIWDQEDNRIITVAEDGVFRVYLNKNDPNFNNPPTITISNPVQDQTINDNFTAKGSVTDDKGVVAVFYKLNEGAWNLFTVMDPWELDIIIDDLVDGVNTLVVKASDGDLEGIDSVSFTVEKSSTQYSPPIIRILSPVQGSSVRDSINVLLEITEGDGGIETIDIRLNEGDWVGHEGSRLFNQTIDITDLPDGELIFEVKATDGIEYSEVTRVLLDHDLDNDPSIEEPEKTVWTNSLFIVMVIILVIISVAIIFRLRS